MSNNQKLTGNSKESNNKPLKPSSNVIDLAARRADIENRPGNADSIPCTTDDMFFSLASSETTILGQFTEKKRARFLKAAPNKNVRAALIGPFIPAIIMSALDGTWSITIGEAQTASSIHVLIIMFDDNKCCVLGVVRSDFLEFVSLAPVKLLKGFWREIYAHRRVNPDCAEFFKKNSP